MPRVIDLTIVEVAKRYAKYKSDQEYAEPAYSGILAQVIALWCCILNL